MNRIARAGLVFVSLAAFVSAADAPAPFSGTLTPAERDRLGLAALTPAQLAALDAAVAAYSRGEKTAAVQQAVAQATRAAEEKAALALRAAEQQAAAKAQEAEKKAAATAVADYRKKSDPGLVARTLDSLTRKQDEAPRPRFKATVVGEFRGWSGGTYFALTDGQVWRQTGTETYELPPAQNAEVEIYQSANGYWRLAHAGAWITVKRVQ
ncbi:MAG: hypothetical protein RLZZ15_3161 [Verrucomicrobiota bacterium]|jgi:hypothetical protein